MARTRTFSHALVCVLWIALLGAPARASDYERTIRLSEHQHDATKFAAAILDTIDPTWRGGKRLQRLASQMKISNWLTGISPGGTSTHEAGDFEVAAKRPNKREYVVSISRWKKTTLRLSAHGHDMRRLSASILDAAVANWAGLGASRQRSIIDQVVAALGRIGHGANDTLTIESSVAIVKHLSGGDYEVLVKQRKKIVAERNVTANPCFKCSGSGWVYRSVGKVRRGQASKVQRYACPTCGGTGQSR